jgi:hypothetical protein
MFSGTGFFDKDGRPVIIYHGQGADRNVLQRPRISLRAHGGDAQIKNLTAWKLRSIFPGFPGPAEH